MFVIEHMLSWLVYMVFCIYMWPREPLGITASVCYTTISIRMIMDNFINTDLLPLFIITTSDDVELWNLTELMNFRVEKVPLSRQTWFLKEIWL